MGKQGSGDIQSHINPVRVRVKGSGNLRAFLYDTGTIKYIELTAQSMSLTTNQSVNYLSNFRAEKAYLMLMISEENEYFTIDNIWTYVKPTAASYPQV